jgi:hypothetical protein
MNLKGKFQEARVKNEIKGILRRLDPRNDERERDA